MCQKIFLQFLFTFLILFMNVPIIQCSIYYCTSLCQANNCVDIYQNSCSYCTVGFRPLSYTDTTTSCIPQTSQTYMMSNYPKYKAVGYFFGNTQLSSLVGQLISSNSSNSNYSCGSYTVIGLFNNNDQYVLSAIGLTGVNFYKFRVRYWYLKIDHQNQQDILYTKFIVGTTTFIRQQYINLIQSKCQLDLCQSSQVQCSQVVDQQFSYSGSSNLQVRISSNRNPSFEYWGVKQSVFMVRLCHPYCSKCTGDSNNQCQSCDWTNKATRLSNTTCNTTCAERYGIDTTNDPVCIQCDTNCLKCLDSATNCLICDPGYYLYTNPNTFTTTCVKPCPSHSYPDDNASPIRCQICSSSCQQCSKISTNCTSCYSGKYYYNNTCNNPCPIQTYVDSLLINCLDCNNYCTTCILLADNCTVCDITGPYKSFLHATNNTCVTECGNGYFQDTNLGVGPNICTLCQFKCATCDKTQTNCSSCKIGYYLFNNTCNIHCPLFTHVQDSSTWTCQLCVLECSDQYYCALGFYLNGNICLDICPSFYIPSKRQCVDICPQNYYINPYNPKYCEPCMNGCQLCSSKSLCLIWNGNAKLNQNNHQNNFESKLPLWISIICVGIVLIALGIFCYCKRYYAGLLNQGQHKQRRRLQTQINGNSYNFTLQNDDIGIKDGTIDRLQNVSKIAYLNNKNSMKLKDKKQKTIQSFGFQ